MADNSYEYIIKRKTEGNILAAKIALILLYVLFPLILAVLTVAFAPPALFTPLILLIIALTALLIFITWRFTSVEYEVVICGGDITITVIYGKGFRKKLLNKSINSFTEIGEYDDRAFEEISKLSLQKNHLCLSSLSAESVYYAIFEENKDQCILYFDAPEQAVALLKKHNSSAFRAGEKRIKGQL
jgi:hypothetical protein